MIGGDTARTRLGPPQVAVRVPLRRPRGAPAASLQNAPASSATVMHMSNVSRHPVPASPNTTPVPGLHVDPLVRRPISSGGGDTLAGIIPAAAGGISSIMPSSSITAASVPGMPLTDGIRRLTGDAATLSVSGRVAACVVPGSRLNPLSVPFTPQQQYHQVGEVAESHAVPAPQTEASDDCADAAPRHHPLYTELPEPADAYQVMVYNNIAHAINSMTCSPASYARINDNFVENLNGWLPSSGIALQTVLDWLFTQVAYVPSFRYVCARLCYVLCSRCHVTQQGKTFRDLLMTRCQQLYQTSESLLASDVSSYCDVMLLFCELYLHVLLKAAGSAGAGDSSQHRQPISVLGSAVVELCSRLLEVLTNPASSGDEAVRQQQATAVCHALKLTGGALEQHAPAELQQTMERVRAAALSMHLPRDSCHALLELVTLRASRWGGHGQPAHDAAPSAAPTTADGVRVEACALTDEEERFLNRQLSLQEDDGDDEFDYTDEFDAFLEQLDHQ